jgi:hypothetical protein
MHAVTGVAGGGQPPRHPTVDGRVPLIVRLGLHDDRVLGHFDGFGMPIVAHTILQNEAHRPLVRLARDTHGLAVLIDPENFLNQVDVSTRRKSFAEARYAARGVLDLRHNQLDAAQEIAYVRDTLAEQRERRATLLVSPYHFAGGPDCQGRQTDLRLARASTRLFRSLQWNEPPPGERFPMQRELYAGMAIGVQDLRAPLDRIWLEREYADLDVDGYFVRIAGLSESSSRFDATNCAEFLLGLWLASQRPVILGGGGNLSMALLAQGLPAVSLGLGEGERFIFPPQTGTRSQGRPVYHAGLMRSVNPKSAHVAASARAHRLFRKHACECGHHPSHRAPKGPERKLHTFSLRYRDATDFSSGSVGANAELLRTRLTTARTIALELGYPPPGAAWEAVIKVGARIRQRQAERQLG